MIVVGACEYESTPTIEMAPDPKVIQIREEMHRKQLIKEGLAEKPEDFIGKENIETFAKQEYDNNKEIIPNLQWVQCGNAPIANKSWYTPQICYSKVPGGWLFWAYNNRSDSQALCFVPDPNYKSIDNPENLLPSLRPMKNGLIKAP